MNEQTLGTEGFTVLIALIVGALVRLVRTDKFAAFLEAAPVFKPVPKKALPWIALILGVLILVVDGAVNGHLGKAAILKTAVDGLFAGALAIAGHETLAKVFKKDEPEPPAPTDTKPPAPPSEDPPKPEGNVLQRIAIAALAATLLVGTTSCAAVASILPHVIAAIVDGGQIIDRIAEYLSKWFAAHPDPVVQPKVELAITKCRAALSVALHAADGASKLDQAKVDAAFDDFKKAYLELIALASPYGVAVEGGPVKARADGATLVVPQPLALKPVPR